MITRRATLVALPVAVAGGVLWWQRGQAIHAAMDAAHVEPLSAPVGPLNVYHLGHSLVGHDMPAMLAQLAGPGHNYASQLGWGASLRDHWEPGVAISGFDTMNGHDHYRDATLALKSGGYDAVVLTEMVEIDDAIRYHASADYLTRWANLAHMGNPSTRVYLYETWHWVDDPQGWLARIDTDLGAAWVDRILAPAIHANPARPIHLIPAGQVLARFVRAVQAAGGVDRIMGAQDLFGADPDGNPDPIHMGDLGNYLVALTHYAVLYHRSPLGLPHVLTRADGTPAIAPGANAARLMQTTVWDVVTAMPGTGVAA